jgi:hypothetical protein
MTEKRARTERPQRITIDGREDVVVDSGETLVEALRESPLSDIDMERTATRSRVRVVDLE